MRTTLFIFVLITLSFIETEQRRYQSSEDLTSFESKSPTQHHEKSLKPRGQYPILETVVQRVTRQPLRQSQFHFSFVNSPIHNEWSERFLWVDLTDSRDQPRWNTQCSQSIFPLYSSGRPIAYFSKKYPSEFTYCNLQQEIWTQGNVGVYPCWALSMPCQQSGHGNMNAQGMVLPGNPIYPPGNQIYPPGNPNYPPGNQIYPPGNPNYPPGNQIYPPGNPNYPPGNQIYLPGNPNYPPWNPNYPPGYPNYPSWNPNQPPGNSNYPSGNPNYPSWNPNQPPGNSNYPSVNPNYPSWNPNQPLGNPNYPSWNPNQPPGNPNYPSWNPNQPSGNPTDPSKNQYLSPGNTAYPSRKPDNSQNQNSHCTICPTVEKEGAACVSGKGEKGWADMNYPTPINSDGNSYLLCDKHTNTWVRKAGDMKEGTAIAVDE